MTPPRVIRVAGVAAVVAALAGCAGGGSDVRAAGNPPGPVCERTLERIQRAAEAAMWNQGMWDEEHSPPPVLLRPDGSPIEFSRIPQSLQPKPEPSELGPGHKYQSLEEWRAAKERYVAYQNYLSTPGYDPIQRVLGNMEFAAVRATKTVDCSRPGVGQPGEG